MLAPEKGGSLLPMHKNQTVASLFKNNMHLNLLRKDVSEKIDSFLTREPFPYISAISLHFNMPLDLKPVLLVVVVENRMKTKQF